MTPMPRLSPPPSLNKKLRVARNFSRAVHTYDEVAILQQEIGTRLLERLELIQFSPSVILDLGSGTGRLTKELSKKYSGSIVINADISEKAVFFARHKHSSSNQFYICTDGDYLPLLDHSVDFVFSNCALQWFPDLRTVFKEVKRILKPQGLFLFSTLGPDTLNELRNSFKVIDNDTHINAFLDMHDIGDLLIDSKLIDPVMDRETLTLTYSHLSQLIKDLRQSGANTVFGVCSNKPLQKWVLNQLSTIYEHYRNSENRLPATFEIIYGHAWSPEGSLLHRRDEDGMIRIPIDHLKRL